MFSHSYERTIQTFNGPRVEEVKDYAYARGVKGRPADSLSVGEHLDVLSLVSHYVDSAVSKTCNVGDDVTYDEFKKIYEDAWEAGCKGITTFRAAGKRYGILKTVEKEETTEEAAEGVAEEGREEAAACFVDPLTGQRECS